MGANLVQINNWKAEAWRFRVLNWHMLRGFGQSIPAAITMSTPFVGYMILYHEKIENYLGGLGGLLDIQAQPGQCLPWIDFSMRLNFVYCGLLLLGIGTIAYRFFSPEAIKDARNITDYVVSSVDNVSARNLRSMYATIHSRRPEIASSFIQRAPWLERKKSLKAASDGLRQDTDGQLRVDVLRSFYSVQDRHTLRYVVYFILLFYALGFLLLSVPGFTFTTRVLCVVG
ncbi:hypothetical protein [Hoeflea sp. IMCC20628]|uniref:hypothetical protein n=1 Tax=Hoeflea sp. IMCC20628 TaxID=1620421 RepID=UPI0012E011E8|nr:hypothetical protein [Hoeflea sp. IMCC20628]